MFGTEERLDLSDDLRERLVFCDESRRYLYVIHLAVNKNYLCIDPSKSGRIAVTLRAR